MKIRMEQTKKHLVVAAMRNEGPFILEWVAWYKMLGFDDVLVVTNDCTDHSEALLKLLQDEGWLSHAAHSPKPGQPPKKSAHMTALAHPLVQACDWMFLCDIDEFLVFHQGDGTVQGFLGNDEPDIAGIAIHWKCFGSSGQKTWADSWVHQTYQRAAATHTTANTFFKSLVYKPARYQKLGAHSPRQFPGQWGEKPNVWVDCAGRIMGNFHPNTNPKQMTRPDLVTHANAQVNHYIIRADECFEFKRGRPSASALKDRYSDDFRTKYDGNDETDDIALAFSEDVADIYAELAAIPGVMRLHHLCCADFVQAMCLKRGDDPHEDARYRHHMAAAERLENERSG